MRMPDRGQWETWREIISWILLPLMVWGLYSIHNVQKDIAGMTVSLETVAENIKELKDDSIGRKEYESDKSAMDRRVSDLERKYDNREFK